MDTLYVGNRIFVNSENRPELFAGGILVSGVDGKVSQIFDTSSDVTAYLQYNDAEVGSLDEKNGFSLNPHFISCHHDSFEMT